MLIDDILDPQRYKRKIIDMQQDPNANVRGLFSILQSKDLPVYNLQGLVNNYESQAAHANGFHFSKAVHNVHPPYNRLWAEFPIPSFTINDSSARMGALVEWGYCGTHETTTNSLCATRKTWTTAEVETIQSEAIEAAPPHAKVTLSDTYAAVASLVIEGPELLFVYPRTVNVIATKLGEPLTVPFAPIYPTDFGEFNSIDFLSNAERLRKAVGRRCNLVWFAMALLNCTNIESKKNEHDAKLQRARIRRGRQPLRDFYTLSVRLPKQKQTTTQGNANTTDLIAFHSVAGHLADYREGKGLFGKYKGVFWIPAHVRGNKDNGVINKRYALKGK